MFGHCELKISSSREQFFSPQAIRFVAEALTELAHQPRYVQRRKTSARERG